MTQLAIYKWYISGIYCQLGDYISPIPPIKGTRNSIDYGRYRIESASHGELSSPPDPSRPMVPWKHSTQIHHTWPRIPHDVGWVSEMIFSFVFQKKKKNTGKQIQLKRQRLRKSIWKFMMPLNSPKIFIVPLLPNRLALDQLNSSIHSFSRFNPKHKRFIDRMRHQDLRVLCGSANLTNGYLRMVAVWGPELHLWDIAHTIHVWYIYLHLP